MKVAIIPANGLGDALLMLIVSHYYQQKGDQVVTFHRFFTELACLFPTPFAPPPLLSALESELKSFDLIIIENDHSALAEALFQMRENGILPQIQFLFPKPSTWQRKQDFIINRDETMTTNLARIINSSKFNGILLPEAPHRKDLKKVAIHPTSGALEKNWRKTQFLQLARKLKEKGFFPVFIMHASERNQWLEFSLQGFEVPVLLNLKQTSDFLFTCGYFIGNDSGLGHLASNLNIPTLTIASCKRTIKLWRPDWRRGEVVSPLLSSHKKIKRLWTYTLPVKKVYSSFLRLVESTP